jgi:hypothetical protein
MSEMLVALLGAALREPEIRGWLEQEILKIIAEIMHRRQADPAFLAASDSVFRKWGVAQTPEEKDAAIKALRDLRCTAG